MTLRAGRYCIRRPSSCPRWPERCAATATSSAWTSAGWTTWAPPGGPDLPAEVTPQRFEVVVTLLSHEARRRVRLRVQVPEEDPCVPTLFDLYPGTESAEREVYDMFGIRFDGHPDPTRILMPEDWEGHPLRKDYGVGTVPVRFKAAGDVR